MSFTVKKALEKGIFNNCRLLTGQSGLQNEIHWVNILEILDDLSHIEQGEFLITTAHGFDISSEKKQLEMLDFFTGRKLAAMAIQTGHYIKEIPSSFISYAKQYRLPLIEIPPETSFKKLTRALMSELVSHELSATGSSELSAAQIHLNNRINDMNRLWLRLIESDHTENLHTEMKYFNIVAGEPYQALLLQSSPGKGRLGMPGSEQEAHLINSIRQTTARILLQRHIPFLIGPSDQNMPLLIQSGPLKNRKADYDQPVIEQLYNELIMLFPDQVILIGASKMHTDIKEFKPALNEAGKALQAARLGLINDKHLVSYNNLGLYRLIMEIKNIETLQEIYAETIAPLIDYDHRCKGALLQTMKAFLHHMSIKKAAEALYIHRHTMRYRLEQIENLTGYNPLVPADALQLNLGLHVFHYLKTLNLLRQTF